MNSGDWLLTASGGVVALAGLGLLGWALLGDRVRTQSLRRRGELRRCGRCWYDMSATEGLTCPECGRTTKRERRLARSRRRWRWAGVALLVVAVGAGTIAYPHSRGGVWRRWLPDTAVILLIPHLDDAWPLEEIVRRQRLAWMSADPTLPERMWDWQWRWLAGASAQVAGDTSRSADADLAWQLLLYRTPCTEAVFERVIGALTPDAAGRGRWARDLIHSHVDTLTHQQLQRAKIQIAGQDWPGYMADRAESTVQHIDEELAARRTAAHTEELRAASDVELNPRALAEHFATMTPRQVGVLYRRFGVPRPRGMGWQDASPESEVTVSIQLIHLDDDDELDCLLRFGWGPFQAIEDTLVLLRRGDDWILAGRFEPGVLSHTLQMKDVVCEGRRWLVIARPVLSFSRRAVLRPQHHYWYRVVGSRLRLVQDITVAGDAKGLSGALTRSLVSGEPQVVCEDNRYAIRYAVQGVATLDVHMHDRPGRLTRMILQQEGNLEYPLSPFPSQMDVPRSGNTWGGLRPAWFLACPDDELLAASAKGLAECIAEADGGVGRTLLGFLKSIPQSEHIQQLRDELENLP